MSPSGSFPGTQPGLPMKIVAALVIAFTGATAVHAQTDMNCRTTISGRVECKESVGAQAERLNREHMERMRESADSMPTAVDLAAARKRALQRKVAKLVKAGKCEEAKAVALDAGDLDTADQAVRLCTPAS